MPEPSPELRRLVESVTIPCASLVPAGGAPASGPSSYVAGHPYLSDGRPWPRYDEMPMFFLCQVNFADVPELPDFPSSGLLQWFVGADDTTGLTFDETAGTVGFEIRWYDDVSAPSLRPPTASTPWHDAQAAGVETNAPLDTTEATALLITAAQMLPPFAELPEGTDPAPVRAWAEAVGEDPDELSFVWDEFVRGPSGPWSSLGHRSNIGGAAEVTQDDPRGSDSYPAASEAAGRLLVELDSEQFAGWGDAGIRHIFGDRRAVATGDVSSVRYHWDCF